MLDELNKIYTLLVTLRTDKDGQAHAQMFIDGQLASEWKGSPSVLTSFNLPASNLPIALTTFGEIAIHRIALKVHKGEFTPFK